MKIITGIARGRKLEEPKGQKIRPTTGLVKESIFNIIQFDIPGRRVLDLFAGTGQLGIEALSRGAISCDFVDQSKDAIRLVQANLASTNLSGGRTWQTDARSFIKRGETYDLIFIDPPYHFAAYDAIVQDIAAFDILSKNGIMVCEAELDSSLPMLDLPYKQKREYRYGRVKIAIYTRLADS